MPEASEPSKADLRERIREQLATMTDERRHDASVAACDRLVRLEPFHHAQQVMLYMPLAHEVDVTAIAIRCFRAGKSVCVPKVDWERRDMSAVEITTFDDHVMDTDRHGLRTPRDGRIVVPTTIDLIVVPALAYSLHGHRLGRGGGYYDRFLPRLRRGATTVGIAFDEQIVDQIPMDQRDRPVDVVVTDRRVATIRTQRSRR
ncbi:MAG: 5-formyltetrahydrofolate cyclo-ligase [Planctomycetota bacterium]|jgi:5-formyltetrahydrofolate cyclo-ligase